MQFLKHNASALIISSFVLIAGCDYQGDVAAGNGYSIQCDKGRNCIVASQGKESVAIEPEVDKYAVVNQYLIGHTVRQVADTIPGYPARSTNRQPGYFIVNTQNGYVHLGLNDAEWRAKLLELNIENTQLSPTGYDAKSNK